MEEKLVLALMGFLLTTIIGGLFGSFLTRRKWRTETEHVIYRAFFDEGIKFLDEISELIGRRFFLLNRRLWVVYEGTSIQKNATREKLLKKIAETSGTEANATDDNTIEDSGAELARHLQKIGEVEKEYHEVLRDWSQRYFKYRNKIRLLVSEDQANRFLDYQKNLYNAPQFRVGNPKSLHYYFLHSQEKVERCTTFSSQDQFAEAAGALEELRWECELFLEQLTTEFSERAENLKLLRVPKTSGGAGLAKRAQKSG